MFSYQDISIQKKLMWLILLSRISGLLLILLAFAVYEYISFRQSMTQEFSTLADTLGSDAAASLVFNDRKTAQELLSALRSDRHVMGAALYDNNGSLFAEYRRGDIPASFRPPAPQKDQAEFGSNTLTMYRTVSVDSGKAGTIVIVSDLDELRAKIQEFMVISLAISIVLLVVTFLVASRVIGFITKPILQLAGIAERVWREEDYTLRAVPSGKDEVGVLVLAFNQMLQRIQERDTELQDARDDLEIRVEKRTEELQEEVGVRRKAEDEMRHARDVAEQASHAKSEFLANMSHEIRTPLNGVMGMTDLALETHLTQEQREYLETVKMSADSLLIVINDILDFSKIEAGRIDLEYLDFNLRDLLESTLKTLALRADEKGLELLCEVAPEVPEFVSGDSARLRQVIVNLVGNAIKFTHHGEVSLRVHLEAQEKQESVLRFTVSDTGIGIPKEKRKLIFDPFAQADTSTTRKYGGTGLGLTISSRLVGMMGGSIWVESEEGKGSQFHFTTRVKSAETKEIKIGQAAPPEILRGVKVLIVDDNRTNRRILEGMMSRWEMKPHSVEDGETALAQLSAARDSGVPFGLILTDMHMPGMDGFTLIEQIRHKPELATATIMMLTSAGHRGDAQRCVELGVAAYLLKPIRQSELREAIARVLGAHAEEGAIALITRFSLHDAREPESVLNILLAEDNPVNQRLAVRLLEKRGHRVTLASNGKEALAAWESQRFDLIFMDVQMPEIDGMEATAAIREKEAGTGRRQPIIALTAHAMKGDREKCLSAGMDGYISKPIRPQELDDILEKYNKLRSGSVNPVEQPA